LVADASTLAQNGLDHGLCGRVVSILDGALCGIRFGPNPGMRLATICARGGSKRLPGKALRQIGGVSLLAHTIMQAHNSGLFDYVVVSSDDESIINVAHWHCARTIMRPAELATDEAGKVPVIRHALEVAERRTGKTFDHIIDLDVTAPLRTLDDIRGFCAKLDTIPSGNLVSVCKARRNPAFNMIQRIEHRHLDRGGYRLCNNDHDIVRSQDAPECWELNASMYGWNRADLLKGNDTVIGPETDIFEMPRERSWDIDDAHDLEIVAFLMSKQQRLAEYIEHK
jgi:CMP-N,N'-diacetyllegionaminic acid synthase